MNVLTKLYRRRAIKDKRVYYSGRLNPDINIQVFNNHDRQQKTDGDLVVTFSARDPDKQGEVDQFIKRLREGL